MTFHIYILINPIDDTVFYVGCTINPRVRLAGHISVSRMGNLNLKKETIHEIGKMGKWPEIVIVDTCVQKTEACFLEQFYIDLFKSFGFELLQRNNKPYKPSLGPIKSILPRTISEAEYNEWLNPKKRLIDGKDIHYYRREVMRKFKFYEAI